MREKIPLSIGIIAHNEEKNIKNILKAVGGQKLKKFQIKEIIVVSSSDDTTNRIVKETAKKDNRIQLISEKERKGKFSAINLFLAEAKSEILILESADTIPETSSFEKLCTPLLKKDVGMTNSRPVPLKSKKVFWNYLAYVLWEMHHRINLTSPKVGELIAFRNIVEKIGKTAVDEEVIASIIKKKGLGIRYAGDSLVYNKCPQNFKDFVEQRRRIFYGHLKLKKKFGDAGTVPSMDLGIVLKTFIRVADREKILWNIYVVILESYSRILGFLDLIFRKDHHKWRISESTKNLGS